MISEGCEELVMAGTRPSSKGGVKVFVTVLVLTVIVSGGVVM